MDVRGDEDQRRCSAVFHPVWLEAELGKCLTGLKFLGRSILMVVGEGPLQNVDDRRIALVAVETDMAAWRHDSATDAQVTIFDGVYLLGQIDGSKNFFVDPAVIRRSGLLSERQTSGKKRQSDRRPRSDPESRFHLRLLELNKGAGSVIRPSAFSFRMDRSLRVEGAEREGEADVVDGIL